MSNVPSVDLPAFTPESVHQMLFWGSAPDTSPFTHKKIVEWCDKFWCQFLDIDAGAEIARLLPILADVEIQWNLFLDNTYTFEQLRVLDLNKIVLPVKWFHDWFQQAIPNTAFKPDPAVAGRLN